jgi:predicted dehydrogenase
VLGTAAIATQRTIPALNQAPSATLLALASRNGDKARMVAEKFGIPRAYAGYEDLLADPDIDAVYVPLPNGLHFEWSVRALEAGKHVLCEKPICLRAADVTRLCAVRERMGLRIEEGFGFRNHPQWAMFEHLRSTNAIGPVRAVHATLAKQFFDPKDVRNDKDAGGGGLYDLGSYAVSACNLIFRRQPERVVATLERDPAFGIDRLSSALLDYGDAHAAFTVATQSGSAGWGSHQQLAVLGATGWLRFNFPYAHARPTACCIEVGDSTAVGSFPTRTISFEAVNQDLRQFERFSRLLLGDEVPSWPIEDAFATLRTIDALFESARTDSWQRLPT